MSDKRFSRDTEILHQGAYLKGQRDLPETAPIHLTTAFNVEDLDALEALYKVKGYTYNRTRNPNRNALAELMTYLEGGEASLCFNSGMAAISTVLLSQLGKGDHLLSDRTLYGESLTLFNDVLPQYGIEVTLPTSPTWTRSVQPSGPTPRCSMRRASPTPCARSWTSARRPRWPTRPRPLLVVDNTFTTSTCLKPLELGADVSINSLTKFANGHSDAVAGSATASAAICQKAYALQVLLGTTWTRSPPGWCSGASAHGPAGAPADGQRRGSGQGPGGPSGGAPGAPPQPGEPSPARPGQAHAQARLRRHAQLRDARRPGQGQRLPAGTGDRPLRHDPGGYRTTLSHPVTSSHHGVPEAERLKMGITFGLMRVSVGIEDPDDLVADFTRALDVFR